MTKNFEDNNNSAKLILRQLKKAPAQDKPDLNTREKVKVSLQSILINNEYLKLNIADENISLDKCSSFLKQIELNVQNITKLLLRLEER